MGAKFIALFLSALASAPLAKKEKKIILIKELIQERYSEFLQPGRGAAWIARLTGGQKAAGSIPVAPINCPCISMQGLFLSMQ